MSLGGSFLIKVLRANQLCHPGSMGKSEVAFNMTVCDWFEGLHVIWFVITKAGTGGERLTKGR